MRTAETEESHANEKWARYVHFSGWHPLQGHEKRALPTLVLRTFCVLRPQVTRNVRHVEGSQVYRRPRRIEAHRVGLTLSPSGVTLAPPFVSPVHQLTDRVSEQGTPATALCVELQFRVPHTSVCPILAATNCMGSAVALRTGPGRSLVGWVLRLGYPPVSLYSPIRWW
jgi:hypothetical protein